MQKKPTPSSFGLALAVSPKPAAKSVQNDGSDCLPRETKDGAVLEPGCFGFSEHNKAAFCVIGTSFGDRTNQVSGEEDWQLISLPQGLASKRCSRFSEDKQPAHALVVSPSEPVMQKMKSYEIKALPAAYKLEPRNTLDIVYSPVVTLRLRWNQMFLKSRDVGCGEVPRHRDRLSLFCTSNQTSVAAEPHVSILSNKKALPLLSKGKTKEETIFLNEEEGLGSAEVYVLDHGQYVLISIQKSVGEPGASSGFYTASLIDVQHCRVISPKEEAQSEASH